MRKVLTILCVLLFAVPLVAQMRTGNIQGKVIDTDGNPIPGVTVTLTGFTIAAMSSTSSADGSFRFLSLHPANDYAVRAELEGFKAKTETGIIVSVGGITELALVMEMGAIEEEITVVAVSPIVETKKTQVTTAVNYEMLQSLPSARDPWVVLQMVPSIQVDRENIGGNESGQQASFVMKGGGTADGVWTMDGVVITDPAAIGASPTYFDFDMFEEMQVTTGGADVETQTGGVALNFVSRRGGNRVSIGGRFYYTDNKFQSDPSGADYDAVKEVFSEANGYPPEAGVNQIRDIKDFGFNLGGPIVKDKAWWWGSYGVQEIKTTIITGSKDDTYLTNYAAKVNIQLVPENRIELFIHSGKKEKFGRSSSSSDPLGWNQRGKFHFGSPIIKAQMEHMFGDSLFVSAQYGYTNSGFGMWPQTDLSGEGTRWYDVENDLNTGSSWWFFSGRPHKVYKINASYFNDDLFGVSHEFKFGAEYVDRGNEWASQSSGSNMRVNFNYNSKTVDWDGDGTRDVVKDMPAPWGTDLRRIQLYPTWGGGNTTRAFSVYASDTISFGRVNLKLGIRYDRQTPWSEGQQAQGIYVSDGPEVIDWYNASSTTRVKNAQDKILESGVAATLDALFPFIEAPPEHNTQSWTMISPRVALTYDLTGDGKTIAKASGAIYGAYMGTWGGYWRKQAGGQGMRFYWNDVNGNDMVGLSELSWANYDDSARASYRAFDDAGNFVGNVDREEGLMWWGYDFKNPSNLLDSRYQIDPNWNTDLTYEA
ncbi:MAG: TonB-dependent receptor, partial [Candidatus Aminicenantaceae bacterium]